MNDPDGPSPKGRMLAKAVRLVGMGWYIVFAILIPLLAGNWLDRQIGTAPLFMLLGLALGLVTSFYGLYKMLLPLLSGKDEDT